MNHVDLSSASLYGVYFTLEQKSFYKYSTEHVATDRFCENSAAWLIKMSSTGK